MKRWLIEKWDWFIYRRAQHSIRRMCERNEGFAYLFEMQLADWRKEHPISPELERATEIFHEALKTWPRENRPDE